MRKIPWIYQIRGLAIIAVVVCHQQFVLHTSEAIQLLTLYSVTTLIFMMGVTASISLKNRGIILKTFLQKCGYVLKKIFPVMAAYFVGTIAYSTLYDTWVNGPKIRVLVDYLLHFSASAHFYFIKYFICFSILSPMIYALVVCIKNRGNSWRWYGYLLLGLVLFAIGYGFMDYLPFLGGGSYLMIYSLGIICGEEEISFNKKKYFLFIGIIILLIGLWSTKIFYFNRITGIHNPVGIDKLVPKLSINPPNLSIMLYSMGVIIVANIFFEKLNRYADNKIALMIIKVFSLLGKYSLDIFIWHLFIELKLLSYIVINNIYIKRVIYYSCMFFIPIVVRYIYEKIKMFIKYKYNLYI
ncbi:MAG: hypothetical protein E7299_09120 [Lachnospiraceae bacterium]|nr:hypothetical protein [Lachnospiraceae bacterium]